MITSHIDDFFAKAISLGKGLVLAIVCETRGSTYSKTGNYMLISEDGRFSSLLSGGCLEGDLVEQAKQVLKTETPSIVTYDLSDEDALLSYNKMFLAYLKTFNRLGISAIPMAADTGPIGGNLSHEFIILADTGESKIFTDKRIFDLNSDNTNLDKSSLEDMRKKYEKFYAVTDEKFNKEEFEKIVSKENQLITKGIEVGHIFYFGDKYSKPMGASVDLPGGKKDFVKMLSLIHI